MAVLSRTTSFPNNNSSGPMTAVALACSREFLPAIADAVIEP